MKTIASLPLTRLDADEVHVGPDFFYPNTSMILEL
jgi:hypothetical protein